VFNDLLTDYERISDHCSNVAVDLLESEKDEFRSHEFHKSLEYRQTAKFTSSFNEYKEKYAI
jgi:phosphate:Na+ symporter